MQLSRFLYVQKRCINSFGCFVIIGLKLTLQPLK